MLKMLLGLYTESSNVKFKSGISEKEAQELLDNLMFSTNIYGKSSNKEKIAFTLPIMYLEGYTHGRIYFNFIESVDSINIEEQINPKYPISLFLTFDNLTDDPFPLQEKIINALDQLIWNYLDNLTDERDEFDKLFEKIKNITSIL